MRSATSEPKRLPPASKSRTWGDAARSRLMTVARRATPPFGTFQPQGSTYPCTSLVCRMVRVRGSSGVTVGCGVLVGDALPGCMVQPASSRTRTRTPTQHRHWCMILVDRYRLMVRHHIGLCNVSPSLIVRLIGKSCLEGSQAQEVFAAHYTRPFLTCQSKTYRP